MFRRIKQSLWGALFGILIATQALGQAALLPNGVQQYFNAQGVPLASGSVYYYTPNTLTPKTTWSSSVIGTGTQNTNPVQLNAGGFATNGSGAIAGTYGSGVYRQQVFDQNGNLIWDQPTTSTGSGGGSSGQVALGDNAYVGDIHAFSGIVAPTNYMFAAGQAISRTTYAALFSVITYSLTLTCSSGGPTLSGIADTTQIPIGAPLEVSCFAPGATVVSKTSSSVTMSTNATTSASVTGVFFPWGNGDGATTFNLPNLSGIGLVGRDNLSGTNAGKLTAAYYGTNPDALGAIGGAQSQTLVLANLPPITPTGTISNGAITSTVTGGVQGGVSAVSNFNTGGGQNAPVNASAIIVTSTQGTSTFTGTGGGGSSTPFSVMQPSATINYIIKVQADTVSAGLIGVTATLPLAVSTSNFVTNVSISGTYVVGEPLLWNGNNPFLQGTLSGNTTEFATVSGALTPGDCIKIDTHGNIIDSGSTGCGGGSGTNIPVYQIFSTPGAVSTLTLTTTPLPANAGLVSILFDGYAQLRNTWSLNPGTGVITFNGGIPSSVQQVEVDWSTPVTFAGVGSIGGAFGAISLGSGLQISGQTLSAIVTPTGSTTARTLANLFGDFLTVKDFGAVGDGTTSDQAAFQSMIDASCPGHLLVVPPAAPVNQIFPIIIPGSANPYIVTELNATNCAGYTQWGTGSGALQPIIKYTSASPGNTIMDMTGSCSGFNLKNFGILGPTSDGLSSSYPNIGLLIAPTSAGGCNFGEIDNVNVGGRFQKAAGYIYGVCCSLGSMPSWNNYNQNNTNTFSVVFTATNYFAFATGAVASNFTTIGSGTFGVSDWTINRGEAHAFTSGGGTSPTAVLLDGVSNMNWTGGQIASCQGFLMRTNGGISNVNFRGTTFYCDNGTNATTLLGATSGSVTHLTLENIYANLATSGTIFSGQSSTSGYMLSGTISRGGSVTQYDINPLGSSAGSFGSALN